ncbi:lipase secretion chaperone [Aliivibrio salmonicida]|uniref:lipase secretion chaperone n=1 Tax=Aliivibrio salmonicida TaxID=40269 RepID=UPI003D147028
MKKVALFIVILAISLSIFSMLNRGEEEWNILQGSSQKDTEVDISSSRYLFDYVLIGLDEANLDTLYFNFNYKKKNELLNEELLNNYKEYKRQLSKEVGMAESDSILSYFSELNLRVNYIQSLYFTPKQKEIFFGEENTWRKFTIDKLTIDQYNVSDKERYQLKQILLNEQPNYIQRSERNRVLITELNNKNNLSGQNLHLERVKLVGDAGAQRLTDLDIRRENFKRVLDDYLSKRKEILINRLMSKEDKELQISSLRELLFKPNKLRRILALERINDKKN